MVDSFIFVGPFGSDTIRDFEIGFDGIVLGGGIGEDDVTVAIEGDDVIITVELAGTQTVLVEGAADLFNAAIDIDYAA